MNLSEVEKATLKENITRRGQSKGAITRIENFCNELNAAHALEDVNIRLEALEKAYLDFKDYDFQLLSLGQPSELEVIETRYFAIKSKLRKAASDRNTVFKDLQQQFHESMLAFADQQRGYLETLSTSFAMPNNDHHDVRLPKLNIPHFCGDYADFPAFRDLYESSVHNRESLGNAQKFQYLKGLLKGEAATLIRHINVTDANYAGAWTRIIERYDKKDPIQQRNKLRQGLYNVADEVFRGLEALGSEAQTRDPWLIHWMLERSDKETNLAWAKASSEKDFPTVAEFMKFLGKECDEIEMVAGPSMKHQTSSMIEKHKSRNFIINRSTNANVASFESLPCVLCDEDHHLSTCQKFQKLDISSRREVAQTNGICYNCLSRNHRVTSCMSRFGCKQCKRRHHTLLHDNTNVSYNTAKSQVEGYGIATNQPAVKLNNLQVNEENEEKVECETTEESMKIHLATNLKCVSTILPTALAKVRDVAGKFVLCRILLDSGSQAAFISEACIQKLGLPRKSAKFTVSGIATNNQYTRGMTSVVIKSRFNSNKMFEMNIYILHRLTTISPVATFNIKKYDYLQNLQLADPNFDQLNEIDIVLGSNKFFEIIENGRLKGEDGNPIAQNTALGWVLAGEASHKSSNIQNFNIVVDEDNIEQTLKKFFECEDLDNSINLQSNEEEEAEAHFKANVSREIDGRYKVALPFKSPGPMLGQSLFQAIQRLKSVERRMIKDPQYKQLYLDFMDTYLTLDHMEKVDGEDITDNHHCYLPHHAVFKNSSTSTKLRTVFDGSAKTSNGFSLNENLMVGPTIQPTLWAILMRFRTHPIALCADVEKMYRQIRLREEDTNFQRIVWRKSPESPIEHFRLKTVTYGRTSAAPFLAIRSLVQLARDNAVNYPQVAYIIQNDFYVDDLLSGTIGIREAVILKRELQTVLSSGGFTLRKWVSNLPELCEAVDPIIFNENEITVKVLGLTWDPKRDIFEFKVDLPDKIKYTKRTLLTESSKVFDPLGWLAPSIIIIKNLFQKLWLHKLGWDDELPPDIATQWSKLRNSFGQFKQISIPRYISWSIRSIQLHGFCDASESAYAAVVYCRVQDENGNIQVNLLTSKTKVAPLKQVTLPKLELCAAVLLSRLLVKVRKEFSEVKIKEFAWTDSTIVLAWLSDQPRRWKSYVANRTSEILFALPKSMWDHVKSAENPADCASRGMLPKTLKSHDLWWYGPKWLKDKEFFWKTNLETSSNEKLVQQEERKKWIQCLHVQTSNETMDILFRRISSWQKIRRVLGYCIRFFNNCKAKDKGNKQFGTLAVNELQSAERVCVLWCQQEHYTEEMTNLVKSCSSSSNGKLSSLASFIDSQGILRVGGRLQNADCAYEVKHPIILPNSHILK